MKRQTAYEDCKLQIAVTHNTTSTILNKIFQTKNILFENNKFSKHSTVLWFHQNNFLINS